MPADTHEEIRIRWTGTARYDAAEVVWALMQARRFRVANIDGKPGWRHGTIHELAAGRLAFTYWTPSRIVVVRIHGPKEDPTDAWLEVHRG